MKKRYAAAVAGVVATGGATAALASHVQLDPTTVPTGFFTAHSIVNGVPAAGIARDLRSGKMDVFIEHGRLEPNGTTGFGASPGPSLINVQRGLLTVEADAAGRCQRKRLINDTGIALRARQANRLTAGPEGADYYVVYLLPRKTGNHRPTAGAPAACAR